jgi:GT2 family glycosyltransferase
MVSGSLMMIKSEFMKKNGLMDEDFFIYWEETDYQYMALAYSYNVWLTNFPYLHYSGSSTGLREQTNGSKGSEGSPRGFYYYYRNQIMYMLINCGFLTFLDNFTIIIAKTVLHSTFKASTLKIKSMFSAWQFIFSNFGKIWEKRKARQSHRKVGDLAILRLAKNKIHIKDKMDSYYKGLEERLRKEGRLERSFYH